MREQISLHEAVAEFVHDGDLVAIEGTAHLVPFAAAHELIRQRRQDLTIARLAPDLLLDQLVGMGCAGRVVFGWGGRPGLAQLHRLRAGLQNGQPRQVAGEQLRQTDMASAYEAGAMNLPMAVLRGHTGSIEASSQQRIARIRCPFTGEDVAAVRSIRPDVALVHAQEVDRFGNVLLWGQMGVQKTAALASRRVIVTVEEIVDDLRAWPNAYQLPACIVSAVCIVPGGAHPSTVLGHYERDHGFYRAWDRTARSAAQFRDWMERHVLATADFAGFRRVLEQSAQYYP